MILDQENIVHELIAIPGATFTKIVGIKLKSGNRTSSIICLYNPPINNLEQELLQKLLALPGDVIVAGDFKVRHRFWNCARGNQSGIVLYATLTRLVSRIAS